MEIAERIQQLIEKLGMNATTFAERIGVERSGLSHIFKGRNKPGLDLIMRIVEEFPEVTADWLLWGKTISEPIPEVIENPSRVTDVNIPDSDNAHSIKSASLGRSKRKSDTCNEPEKDSNPIPANQNLSENDKKEVKKEFVSVPDDKPGEIETATSVPGISKVILLHRNGKFSVYEAGESAE